ncbi:MAG TPA: hypothetical protein DEB09_05165 [Candidatus Magasanikbacteria bacterium]|nr:hypothetical protein [Candidatus Magasanikbacteria bacterium]
MISNAVHTDDLSGVDWTLLHQVQFGFDPFFPHGASLFFDYPGVQCNGQWTTNIVIEKYRLGWTAGMLQGKEKPDFIQGLEKLSGKTSSSRGELKRLNIDRAWRVWTFHVFYEPGRG